MALLLMLPCSPFKAGILRQESIKMAVSEAKLEANRRNGQKSCGAVTEAGKSRSKLNAVKQGMRAATLVLLDEDPQALEDRRNAWRVCLLPGDDVEQRLVEDAIVSTWLQDRARRARVARLNINILNDGVSQAQTNEEEVAELGRLLFTDRMGPLTFYPTGCEYGTMADYRYSTTSFAACQRDEPERPSALVLRLQSTLLGCEWLLDQWAGLKAILERGQPFYMNATGQNATNEPTLAAQDDGGVDERLTAGMNDGDDSDFQAEFDRDKVGEWIRAGTAMIAARRAEFVRKLNEQTRRQAKDANAGRRPRPEWHKNGKPADRP
jgi:hypothetical protein